MRKYIKYNVLGMILLSISIVSCDLLREPEQDASPVASPDGYPIASFSSNVSGGTVSEIDTVTYTITMDKMIDRAVTFNAHLLDGSTVTSDDYEIVPAVVQPWSNEAELQIIFHDDGIPSSESKTAQFEISVDGIAERNLLNPSQEFPTADLTVNNYNDPTLLTVAFAWDTEDDIDMVTWSDTEEYPMEAWGDGGATGANPEIDKSIWLSDPVGTYYVSVIDWGADPFNYTFTLGYPDGSVETITGTFDTTANEYTTDVWDAWGEAYATNAYRVLKVENDGTTISVTKL